MRQLNSISPNLKYYYMGFYIHSCPKMRYKAKFQPSYLLCPLRYTWHAIDECIKQLDKTKYSVFNKSEDAHADNNTLNIENVNQFLIHKTCLCLLLKCIVILQIQILYSGTLMTYSMYKRMKNMVNQDKLITEYTLLVGPDLARQLIYCFLD